MTPDTIYRYDCPNGVSVLSANVEDFAGQVDEFGGVIVDLTFSGRYDEDTGRPIYTGDTFFEGPNRTRPRDQEFVVNLADLQP